MGLVCLWLAQMNKRRRTSQKERGGAGRSVSGLKEKFGAGQAQSKVV